jgi:hypothetical protein
MDISVVKKLVGKRLLWIGNDPENGFTYLLFEDMNAFAIEGGEMIQNGSDVMNKILKENISEAENVVSLKNIMEKSNGTQPTVSKEASGAPSPPNS